MAGPDPLGKRALFQMPVQADAQAQSADANAEAEGADLDVDAGAQAHTEGANVDRAEADRAVTAEAEWAEAQSGGKRALYSSAPVDSGPAAGPDVVDPAGSGPVAVSCPACGVVSRIGWLDLLVYQLPLGYWVPWRGHRMTCPACRRRVWAGLSLR